MANTTQPRILRPEGPIPTGSRWIYLVITPGGQADVDLVGTVTGQHVYGVADSTSVRDCATALVGIFGSSDSPDLDGVVVIAPPKNPHNNVKDEIVRRLDPDKTWVARHEAWGDHLTLTGVGPEGVSRMIARARLIPISAVLDNVDLVERALDQFRNPARDLGVTTGWTELDAHYRPAPGYVSIVTGVPSHGKSTWLDALLTQLSQLHGWKHAIFSPESYPVHRHALKIAARVAEKPWLGANAMGETTVESAMTWVGEHFYFLDPDVGLDIDEILEAAGAILRRHGINGLVIDPWNEIEHARPRELTETEYISLALRRIRRWARAHRVHVWVVAHPAKPPKPKSDLDGPYIPTLYDISGSANWFNKADAGLTIWRNPSAKDLQTRVYIQKVRVQPEQGCPGMIMFEHNPATGIYLSVVPRKGHAVAHPTPRNVSKDFLRDWVNARAAA